MLGKFRLSYQPLDPSGDSISSSVDEERRHFIEQQEPCCKKCALSSDPSSRRWSYISLFSLLLPWALLALISSASLFCLLFRHPGEVECARMLSAASPALESSAIQYHDATFHNAFGLETEYQGLPTPELELRWGALWMRGMIEVSKNVVEKLNKSTENLKPVVSDDPARGYAGVLEVFHHLHCLNQIRQFTWKDHYETHMAEWVQEHPWIIDLNVTNPQSDMDRKHVDHCIEALRLQLMCAADVTPVLLRPDPDLGVKADFDVHHRCRDWDLITNWQDNHKIELQ
ncbi:hypothetical protein F5B22DRAFT_456338 [Xylaria bambusicola]|uniref:uncharacterized protein n=1 Tax=Xylaria bambusicola TaxID=326684 RepID=UPI002007ECF2|nr:uncharacterized protein F5B22DRAFT_456338 [Xylaria bambusicola]KAI0506331.1 hypothetical protein F5B22DRAFT_456338 [Xylaria bambusicola]